eukprot:gnl/TRDRNA2_/TRDRNA2_177137_c0_seq5.p1 gnl/TRDRNA2_/TRDRNA2_177137_c0~~gnl/TRDRNA2_/TRDRNA2_177137_c0_seq5.p1  ORF type:complete len:379 (+),score=-25.52 gnl/TRDRNA2_/TRDRNA2_177137_c0_seq5:29-1165(+)
MSKIEKSILKPLTNYRTIMKGTVTCWCKGHTMKYPYKRSRDEKIVLKKLDVLTLDRNTTSPMSSLPKVVIIGRPNVGKSTLYNRISGSQNAVVYNSPGITRDRLNCFANWNGIEFQISDTAGILSASSLHCMKSERKKSEFSHTTTFEIMQQTNLAIKDSDVLVMVVDGLDGPTDHDNQIITWLRRYYGDKHIILAVNKCDKEINADIQSSYFWELGLEPIPTSAIISSSINNLLDSIVEAIPNKSDYNKVSEEKPLKVTFIGRPNVGKSSLLNSILAEKRHIVSELPGSTRDAIETPFLTPNGHFFTLVDTFGIGKKSSYINSAKETSLSAQQTLRRIRLTDVVVLVLDVTEGVTVQDFRLSENIVKEKKSMSYCNE